MIGKKVSHYYILSKLGEGGMGVVYKSRDTKLNRIVALKFLSSHLTNNAEANQRFIREAHAAAALNHPNICTIHDIGEFDDQIYIVMEYIEGQSLENELKSEPLQLTSIMKIIEQVCDGLKEAHNNGIIHRDIKPGNIMITAGQQVKIMDFGLAHTIGQTKITQHGSIRGTTAYMSFEQANSMDVDQRTDIWSLGVVLYEMLTGQLPFTGDSEQVVIYSILNKEPKPITNLRKDISGRLQEIVNRTLSKNINKRYQKVSEFSNDLKNVNTTTHAGSKKRKSRSPRKRLMMYTVSLLLLIVITIIIHNLFFKSDKVIDSIAVLPLKNLSSDPAQKYFVEGMQDALITNLSQISALRVISKTSTMQYDMTDKSIPEIARELNVDALIEGSILRDGTQIRITAQLILGSEDDHLWAKSYDRDLDHILPLISEIAQAIAEEIEITVNPQELEKLTQKRPVNLRVHELVLQGRYYYDRFQFDQSLYYYQQSVDLDAEFAPAHAGVSASYLAMGFLGRAPASEVIPKAREAALKAIALDENEAGGYGGLGYIQLYYDWDWESARKNLLKALDLNPNGDILRHAYADYLMVMGDLEESLNQVRIGRLYNPLSPLAGTFLDFHRILMRQYDEVIEEGRKAIAKNPDLIVHLSNYHEALWLKGMYKEAFAAYKKTWGRDKKLLEAMEKGYSEASYRGAIYHLAEALAKQNPEFDNYVTLAKLYTRAGEPDSALVWLDKAYKSRQPQILHVKAMPVFDELHSKSEFQDILRRIGFPDIKEK